VIHGERQEGDQIEKKEEVKVNCKFSGDFNVLFLLILQLQLIDFNISYCFVKELYCNKS